MSEQMLHFSTINWVDLLGSTKNAAELAQRKNIAVYVRVHKDSQLVHYKYDVLGAFASSSYLEPIPEPGIHMVLLREGWKSSYDPYGPCSGMIFLRRPNDTIPMEKFDEDLTFLRLDNHSLDQIRLTQSSIVSNYSLEGYSIPRLDEVNDSQELVGEIDAFSIDPTEIKDIELVSLTKVLFRSAVIIDKSKWQSAPPPTANPSKKKRKSLNRPLKTKITELNFYFKLSDIEALTKKIQHLADYPYPHRARMPSIYWMYQAAYALNERKDIKDNEDVAAWLTKDGRGDIYGRRSLRTAKKFVWAKVKRGADTGEFNVEDFDGEHFIEKYQHPFVSKGLSLILGIADWWAKYSEGRPYDSKIDLAKKLFLNRFDGLEIGDLVYLISGSQMSLEEENLFLKYREELRMV
jgi:hypothetical protein